MASKLSAEVTKFIEDAVLDKLKGVPLPPRQLADSSSVSRLSLCQYPRTPRFQDEARTKRITKDAIKEAKRRVLDDLRVCKKDGVHLAETDLSKDHRFLSFRAEGIESIPADDSRLICQRALRDVLREELGAIFSDEGLFERWQSAEHEEAALLRTSPTDLKSGIDRLEVRISRIRDATDDDVEKEQARYKRATEEAQKLRKQADEMEEAARVLYRAQVDRLDAARPKPEDLERKRRPLQARLEAAKELLKRRKAAGRGKAAEKKARARPAAGAQAGRAAKKARKEEDDDATTSADTE